MQVTNLGINVKDSPRSTLVFVTALDSGAPVAQAHVSILSAQNQALWSGMTNADGIALAPALALRRGIAGETGRSSSPPRRVTTLRTWEYDWTGDVPAPVLGTTV